MSKFFVICVCLLLTSLSIGKGDAPAPSSLDDIELIRTGLVRRIGPYSKIEDKAINGLIQDRDGFIWVATIFGVYRYDGVDFVDYTDKFNRPANRQEKLVFSMIVDSNGVLWFGTFKDLYRYDRKYDKIVKIEGVGSSWVVCEDPFRRICILDANGILKMYSIDGENLVECDYTLLEGFRKESLGFSSLSFDSSGKGWLIERGGTLIPIVCTENSVELADREPLKLDLSEGSVIKCSLFEGDSLWVGTNPGGLYRFNVSNGEVEHYSKNNVNKTLWLPGNRVGWIKKDNRDRIWVGVYDSAVALFVPSEKRFEKISYTKSGITKYGRASPMSSAFDRDGNLWIGSLNLGLFYVDLEPTLFSYENLISESGEDFGADYVNAYLEATDGSKWVGLRGNGLSRKVDGRLSVNVPYGGKTRGNGTGEIVSIAEDDNGRIWAGAGDGSLLVYDSSTQKTKFLERSILHNFPVYVMLPGADSMWLGLNGRLVKVDCSTFEVESQIEGVGSVVRSLFWGPKGRLWVGTQDGLYIYDFEIGDFLKRENGQRLRLFSGRITDVEFLDSGKVWVASYGGGLRLFSEKFKTESTITVRDGLPSEAIASIEVDGQGVFWLGTRSGVLALDPDTKKFVNFDIEDGLQSNRFEPMVSTRREDGSFVFPSSKGLLILNPRFGFAEKKLLKPHLTLVEVLDQEVVIEENSEIIDSAIGVAESLLLKHYENVFSVSYTAINYEKKGRTWFRYRLLGLDSNWSPPTMEKKASFANLSSGEYTLELMASNDPNEWFGEVRRLRVTVLPSFWTRWWVLLGCAVCAIGLFYLVILLRTRHLNRRRNELERLVATRTSIIEERNAEILGQNQELAKHRNDLENMVEERTRDLIKAKEQAEQADHLKSAFLANMSHEIRTPLNAIVGFSQMLASLDRDDGGVGNEYAEVISDSADGLAHLIDDILDISKLESGQLDVAVRSFNVLDLCRTLNTEYKRRLQEIEKPISLIFESSMLESVYVKADPHRTRQVLVNFLDNALKFTQEGSISIQITQLGEWATVAIRDTGIGIAEKDQKNVFDRFRKLESNGDVLFRGAGLGLAISHKLAELMGGSIELKSELGKGSVFSLSLPLADEGVFLKVPKRRAARKSYNLKGVTVAVAEDEFANFSLIEHILKPVGVTVSRAVDGLDLVEMFDAGFVCDLVVMDLQMPRMDGVEAMRQVKARFPDLPIIAYTADALVYNREKAMAEGFDDYLSKPIRKDDLLSVIESLCGRFSDTE